MVVKEFDPNFYSYEINFMIGHIADFLGSENKGQLLLRCERH